MPKLFKKFTGAYSEGSEPVGSPVMVVKVCFAFVVTPFTGKVVKVCSGPKGPAPLESVSLCTRFSGFSTISSFSFNRLPFELKIGRRVLWDSSNVRTKGFCSGLLHRADMRQNV